MANTKTYKAPHPITGLTVDFVIRQDATGFYLDDVDGDFRASPADEFISATEDSTQKGVYVLEESRTAHTDGKYTVAAYLSTDHNTIVASGRMIIASDIEIVEEIMRGTDGANTTTPDAAGTAPTAIENRQEMDSNSTQLQAIKAKTDNLPDGVLKNTALLNFPFFMLDSSDHVSGKTGLSITATRAIDAGSFAPCANSPVEVSNGIYTIDFDASDLNGDTITFRFTATGADDRIISVVTQT